MVMRRAVVLCRRCSGWRRWWGSNVWSSTSGGHLGLERSTPFFCFTQQTHISYRHEHWLKYRCSSVSKLNTKHKARHLASLWTKIQDWIWVHSHSSSVQSSHFLQSTMWIISIFIQLEYWWYQIEEGFSSTNVNVNLTDEEKWLQLPATCFCL